MKWCPLTEVSLLRSIKTVCFKVEELELECVKSGDEFASERHAVLVRLLNPRPSLTSEVPRPLPNKPHRFQPLRLSHDYVYLT